MVHSENGRFPKSLTRGQSSPVRSLDLSIPQTGSETPHQRWLLQATRTGQTGASLDAVVSDLHERYIHGGGVPDLFPNLGNLALPELVAFETMQTHMEAIEIPKIEKLRASLLPAASPVTSRSSKSNRSRFISAIQSIALRCCCPN